MADIPTFNLQQRISQQQKQVQTQKMSQQQILSLKLLGMSNEELREKIYETVEKNPALVISYDSAAEGVKNAREYGGLSDTENFSSATKARKDASDIFQKALESSPDTRRTLCEHLEHQFLSTPHSPAEEKLGLKLIYNLDSRGFHILAPISLLDKNDSLQTEELLEKLIKIINQLDPIGTCCKNFEESLYIQAVLKGGASELTLFILDGHFDFLNPPQPAKILKKINDYNSKFLVDVMQKKQMKFTEQDVLSSLEYIRKLDPFPAREFSPSDNRYIEPDVFVEKDEKTGEYIVKDNYESLPVIEISKDFAELAADRSRVTKSTESTEQKRSEHRFVMDSVRDAKQFIENIEFRKKTLLLACREIVLAQYDFFEKGQRYLKPLRQKDIAKKIGVHEATISRMANEKYMRCPQGLFSIGFFFTNAVSDDSFSQNAPNSKTGIMYELKMLLEEHKNDKKTLSDQKIADLLLEKGIKIARRTVAKYRAQLNVESSYNR
mgnify:CR=1 FL=1